MASQRVADVKEFGAKGDGIADDTAAIVKAYASAVAKEGEVYFPAGIYYYNSNLLFDGFVAVRGAVTKDGDHPPIYQDGLGRGTILRPGPLVTAAITLNAGQLKNLILDGSLTNNAIGVTVGGSGVVTGVDLALLRIYGFTGASGIGLKIRNAVSTTLDTVRCDSSGTNCELNPESLNGAPTTIWFKNCYFSRSTVGPGLIDRGGYQAVWQNCVFESNKQQGFLLTGLPASPADYYTSILRDCWFEQNWRADATATNYQLEQDSPGVAAGIHLDNCKFQNTAGCDNVRLWQTRCCTISRLQFVNSSKHVRIEQADSSVQFLTPVYGADGNPLDPAVVIENPDNATIKGPFLPNSALGVPDDQDVDEGYIGELLKAEIGRSAAVDMTSGTPIEVTSLEIPVGNWDVWGFAAVIIGAGATAVSFTSGVSPVNNDWFGFNTFFNLFGISWAENGNDMQTGTPCYPLQTAVPVTVYLVTRAGYSGGAEGKAYGGIYARRRG